MSTNVLFRAQLLPWQRPAEWVWECESHGHLKGKQVSFMTTTQPEHSRLIENQEICAESTPFFSFFP